MTGRRLCCIVPLALAPAAAAILGDTGGGELLLGGRSPTPCPAPHSPACDRAIASTSSPSPTIRHSGVRAHAGHRDTHLRFLRELAPGDLVELECVGGARTRYRVEGRAM